MTYRVDQEAGELFWQWQEDRGTRIVWGEETKIFIRGNTFDGFIKDVESWRRWDKEKNMNLDLDVRCKEDIEETIEGQIGRS